MEDGRMGNLARFGGTAINSTVPLPIFNTNAPSFGEGFTSSPLASAWGQARGGDFRPMFSMAAPVVGGTLLGPAGYGLGRLLQWAMGKFGNDMATEGQQVQNAQPSAGQSPGVRGSGGGAQSIPLIRSNAVGWGAPGNFSGIANSPYLMQFGGWGGNPTGLGGGLASLTEDPSGLGLSHTVTRAL